MSSLVCSSPRSTPSAQVSAAACAETRQLMPPPTGRYTPVMLALAGDPKNTTVLATSTGWESLVEGVACRSFEFGQSAEQVDGPAPLAGLSGEQEGSVNGPPVGRLVPRWTHTDRLPCP